MAAADAPAGPGGGAEPPLRLSNEVKLRRQMKKRGWTEQLIREAMRSTGIPTMVRKGRRRDMSIRRLDVPSSSTTPPAKSFMWVARSSDMAADREQVFVFLQDEGVDVWRPTQAERQPDGGYRLLPTPDDDPDDEKWQFPPGSRVWCEQRKLSGGDALVAVRAADSRKRSA
jgi:hypothetical protein